jgi:hypothetical protein
MKKQWTIRCRPDPCAGLAENSHDIEDPRRTLMAGTKLAANPIHLGLGATADIEPLFTGSMDWYTAYSDRYAGDGVESRLVSISTFTESWDMWEMHPLGSEVVLCISGSITLHQEMADGSKATVRLDSGEYAINEPGTWHTADLEQEATALFITAGAGTQHRQR